LNLCNAKFGVKNKIKTSHIKVIAYQQAIKINPFFWIFRDFHRYSEIFGDIRTIFAVSGGVWDKKRKIKKKGA
jgi:hypothetical protein